MWVVKTIFTFLSLSHTHISRITFNMLRRWLKSGVETPLPEQYLPEPCQTPEKASEYAAANFEVLETITTSARKQKRGEYNHYSPDQQYKMAKYAVENRVSKAAKHFSKHLGKNINESSIRTIFKKTTKDDFSKGLECDKRCKTVMLGKFEDVVDYI